MDKEEINRRRAASMALYHARRREEFALPAVIDAYLRRMQERGAAFVVFDKKELMALFRGGST